MAKRSVFNLYGSRDVLCLPRRNYFDVSDGVHTQHENMYRVKGG